MIGDFVRLFLSVARFLGQPRPIFFTAPRFTRRAYLANGYKINYRFSEIAGGNSSAINVPRARIVRTSG